VLRLTDAVNAVKKCVRCDTPANLLYAADLLFCYKILLSFLLAQKIRRKARQQLSKLHVTDINLELKVTLK